MWKVLRFAQNVWEILPADMPLTCRPAQILPMVFDTRIQAEKWAELLNSRQQW
jgi:hypothetical protein